jgi:hypothetical protein
MPSSATAEVAVLTAHQRAIVRALLYFDVFGHPLREDEIARFIGLPGVRPDVLHNELLHLCAEGMIQRHGEHFGFGNVKAAVTKRDDDNARAQARMNKAFRMSRLIGRFPFVRAVMLSGSISKGCLAKDGDIDYFIITEPGRLWVARTLLILFKKVFLLNSRRDFCLNYFVDTEHLAIEDRNLFTATEVMTLIPTYDARTCEAFFLANTWAADMLPNLPFPDPSQATAVRGVMKNVAERALGSAFGDELDEWFMLRTLRHWKHKFAEFDRERFDRALRTRRYVSKHHPRDFQRRVLDALAERITCFEGEHGLGLS